MSSRISYIVELKKNGDYIAFNRRSQDQVVKISILNSSAVVNTTNDDYSFVGSDSGKAKLQCGITRNKSKNDNIILLDFDDFSIHSADGTQPFYIEYAVEFILESGACKAGEPDSTDWFFARVMNASENTSIKFRVTESRPSATLQWSSDITATKEENV